jgi:hypothetical protein
MRIHNFIFSIAAALILCGHSEAGTLYAATAGAHGELYILDHATGAVLRDVGPLNDAAGRNYPVTGLAFHPLTKILYGSTHDFPTGDSATLSRLVTINPATAEVTVVGEFNVGNTGSPATMTDLSFTRGGLLYGIGSVGSAVIFSVNIATGKADAWVGPAPGFPPPLVEGGGIASNSSFSHYLTPTANQFSLWQLETGHRPGWWHYVLFNPAKPAGGGNYGALDFDDGILYGLNVGPGSPPRTHLVRFHGAQVTDLGRTIDGLEAIAFIPEPSTLAMFGLSIIFLAVCPRSSAGEDFGRNPRMGDFPAPLPPY